MPVLMFQQNCALIDQLLFFLIKEIGLPKLMEYIFNEIKLAE
jgi:hypothetical protein